MSLLHAVVAEYQALVQTKAGYDRLACPADDEAMFKQERRQGRHQLSSLRQVIETVNGLLDEVFGLKFPKARSPWGLLARLGAKIAALNLAIHFNLLTNRPKFSRFDPFA